MKSLEILEGGLKVKKEQLDNPLKDNECLD